jgi:hypothetical protein
MKKHDVKSKPKSKIGGWLLVLITAGAVLSARYWLPLPGTFLQVPDRIEKADCLVPLRGDDFFRFQKTVDLFSEGYSPNIVLSVTPEVSKKYDLGYRVAGLDKIPGKDLTFKYFEYFGKNPERIFITEFEVTSTFSEAVATRKLMEKNGFKSLILVTSEYHMRRALWIFRWVFQGTGIEIYNATADSELFDPSVWWRKERDVRRVAEEYGSFVLNFIFYIVLGKQSTGFDTV